MAGPRTDRALDPSDARLYHQGHVFGGGERGDDSVTIGYSSGAKVWSTSYTTIRGLVQWCQNLAQLIGQNRNVKTGTNLDELTTGTKIDQLPDHIIGVDWHRKVYQRTPHVETTVEGNTQTLSILDLDLEACPDDTHIDVKVSAAEWECELQYSPFNAPYFTSQTGQPDVQVVRGPTRDNESLVDYLNERPLSFFTPDFARLEGEEEYEAPEYDEEDTELIPEDRYRLIDWEQERVDIKREFNSREHQIRNGYRYSIHGYLQHLLIHYHDIVFYDHSTGEAADFVAFNRGNPIVCILYHCKSSNGESPSARDGDIYEICGQAVKCIKHVGDFQGIVDHVQRRWKDTKTPKYLKGNDGDLDELKESVGQLGFDFRVVLVQPGISKSELAKGKHTGKASHLASCDRYLRSSGAEEVRIMASA
jgi:hypothetical protein